MIDFSDFAQRIGSVLMEGSSTSAFVRTLFEAIIPEDRYYLLDKSQSSFKSYYNGRVNIVALAKKINTCVQIESFEMFIKDSGETAIRKLCEVFADTIPEFNESNAGRMLAEYFDRIITEAASVKKRQGKKAPIKEFEDGKISREEENGRMLIKSEGWRIKNTGRVSPIENHNEKNQSPNMGKGVNVIGHTNQVIINNEAGLIDMPRPTPLREEGENVTQENTEQVKDLIKVVDEENDKTSHKTNMFNFGPGQQINEMHGNIVINNSHGSE